MRNLGGAIGIAGCGTILNDRTNLHFLRLAEHLNTANPAIVELLRRVGAAGDRRGRRSPSMARPPPCGCSGSLTWREAQTLTFADAFLAVMACFVIATIMVPLMRKVVPPKAPSADAH